MFQGNELNDFVLHCMIVDQSLVSFDKDDVIVGYLEIKGFFLLMNYFGFGERVNDGLKRVSVMKDEELVIRRYLHFGDKELEFEFSDKIEILQKLIHLHFLTLIPNIHQILNYLKLSDIFLETLMKHNLIVFQRIHNKLVFCYTCQPSSTIAEISKGTYPQNRIFCL